MIDETGYIVTNAHVVRGAERLQVVLPNPGVENSLEAALSTRTRVVPAQIVGVSRELDLAVVKVDAGKLPALSLADYRKLGQGEMVFAFGSPEGLRNSVTMGVVSAVARQTDPDSPMVYIQTDAAINPGNSGGPLVNVDRQVVGVSTFILSQSGGNEGLGFAVPSGVVGVAYRQLRNFGHLHRAQIGIGLQTITPVLAAALRLPRDYGVVISDVLPDSPAAAFGLQIGDVLAVLDGRPGRIFPSSHFTFFLWNTVKRSIWTFFAGRIACRLMCRWLSHRVTRTKSPRWRTRRKAWLRRSEFLPWKSIKGLPPWFRISATRLEFL